MLKSVICTFCGFNFSFCNQLPDFRGLNICQDWVKFSYLWMSVFLHFCVYFKKKKYKTSLYHRWESEVHSKRLSDILGHPLSPGLSHDIALEVPWSDPLPGTSPLLTHNFYWGPWISYSWSQNPMHTVSSPSFCPPSLL